MAVTFGTKVQLDPNDRTLSRRAWQKPDARNYYHVLKIDEAEASLYMQIREVGVGWQTETETITGGIDPISSGYDFIFTKNSERMIAWRDSNGYVRTQFDGNDASTTSTQHTSSGLPGNGASSLCLTSYGISGALLAFTWDHNSDGTFDLYYRIWDGVTRTWGTLTSLTRPNYPSSQYGVLNVRVLQSQVDDRVHFFVAAREATSGSLATWNLYHLDLDSPTVWTRFGDSDPGWPSGRFHGFDAALSYTDSEEMFVVAADVESATQSNANLRVFIRDDQGQWSDSTIHISATAGAHAPQVEIDTNDDLYVVWREYNTTDSFSAVYFRRRIALTGTWEDPVLVANSETLTTVANLNDIPYSPTMIRSPIGQGIKEFCVVWGDRPADEPTETYVFVNCGDEPAPPGPPGEGFGPGDLAKLNVVYMLDFPAGGPWYKWKGTAARVLNCLRWLALDPVADDSELLWGDAGGDGAYVNQLLTGYADLDANITMRWTTPKTDMGDAGVVKTFRYVTMRVSTIGAQPITFSWTVDEGRYTGSFTISAAGSHTVSLPQVNGRDFQLTITEVGQVAPPIIEDVSVWWRAKKTMYHKRVQLT